MKTADLTGAVLDYWVARARKLEGARIVGAYCEYDVPQNTDSPTATNTGYRVLGTIYAPHEDWDDCGPLIEELGVSLMTRTDSFSNDSGAITQVDSDIRFFVSCYGGRCGHGPTPQIAICRAVVASVFGEEVEGLSDSAIRNPIWDGRHEA